MQTLERLDANDMYSFPGYQGPAYPERSYKAYNGQEDFSKCDPSSSCRTEDDYKLAADDAMLPERRQIAEPLRQVEETGLVTQPSTVCTSMNYPLPLQQDSSWKSQSCGFAGQPSFGDQFGLKDHVYPIESLLSLPQQAQPPTLNTPLEGNQNVPTMLGFGNDYFHQDFSDELLCPQDWRSRQTSESGWETASHHTYPYSISSGTTALWDIPSSRTVDRNDTHAPGTDSTLGCSFFASNFRNDAEVLSSSGRNDQKTRDDAVNEVPSLLGTPPPALPLRSRRTSTKTRATALPAVVIGGARKKVKVRSTRLSQAGLDCGACSKTGFQNPVALRKHIKSVHTKTLTCPEPECGTHLAYNSQMVRHNREKHNGPGSQALYCRDPKCKRAPSGGKKPFTRPENLRRHMNKVHGPVLDGTT